MPLREVGTNIQYGMHLTWRRPLVGIFPDRFLTDYDAFLSPKTDLFA